MLQFRIAHPAAPCREDGAGESLAGEQNRSRRNHGRYERQDPHTPVDHLPGGEVPAARKILRALMDTVKLSPLGAPLDDEPETEDERATVKRALAEPHPDTPHEEVLRELGL